MRHILALSMLLAAFAGQVSAQTSKIVSGSTKFSVKFILGTCNGTFDAPRGEAVFNEKNPENASFNVRIAANTFKTNNNSRDKDMKSDKYFWVEKYPDIHFKSSKVEKKDGKYQVTGTLTMRDVSKTVTLPFEAKKSGDGSYAITSTFDVNRLDYKIGEKDWKLKDIVTVNLQATIK
ncbi:polyisoprenoid-binding protein [Dyadobacter beijingensis]|uniref:Polyisoprenoid-binding protein n=1 Tax=Dyadobacter beijingensis TaxID=365489 RepID=A0ABQ2HDQ2_9BACT|nr:YceI family protein [Dyadobacter beijingensis]GGM77670.1 polyisoprenoid-binding protein [Dyadobacter beijingensis]